MLINANLTTVLIVGGIGLVAGVFCLFVLQSVFGFTLKYGKKKRKEEDSPSASLLDGVQIHQEPAPTGPSQTPQTPQQYSQPPPGYGQQPPVYGQPPVPGYAAQFRVMNQRHEH